MIMKKLIYKFFRFVFKLEEKLYCSAIFKVAEDKVIVWDKYERKVFNCKDFLIGFDNFLNEKNITYKQKLRTINNLKRYLDAINKEIEYLN